MRHFHITVEDGKRTKGALVLTEDAARSEAQIERAAGKEDGTEHRKAGYVACLEDCFIGKA